MNFFILIRTLIGGLILTVIVHSVIILGGLAPSLVLAEQVEYIDPDEIIVEEVVTLKPQQKNTGVLNKPYRHGYVQKNLQPVTSVQPTVRVEDIPIQKTQATELKQSRKDAEIHTEQRIVEKLEGSRLKDEQERFHKLFKPAPGKTTVISPGYRVVEPQPDIVTAVKAHKNAEPEEPSKDRIFLGLMAGQVFSFNQQVVNLRSFPSIGMSLGSYDDSGLIMSASFFYSTHQITPSVNLGFNNFYNYDNYIFTDVQQLTGALSIKYSPMPNRFKPYAGLALTYHLWMYQHNNNGFLNLCTALDYAFCRGGFYRTNSVDLGINAGADIQLNKKIDVGFNMLISVINLFNNHSSRFNTYYQNVTPITFISGMIAPPITMEETNWFIASISAKFYF